jgi:Domain of unknown function (DUF4190)/Protein of unknown function (DUF2510)
LTAPGPGWYPDPAQPDRLGYWDGLNWTDHNSADHNSAGGPPPPPPPWYPPPARTSGLAVASLVLSLVWLGGLGSVLAIIFGTQAKKEIRGSPGYVTGDGMATAGIVLGILGIMGAVTVWIGLIVGVHEFQSTVKQISTPRTLSMGQTAHLSGVDSITGISRVTVYSYTQPVASADPNVTPAAGQQFATAYVQVCAGTLGSQDGPSLVNFAVVFANGSQVPATSDELRQPSLGAVRSLAPNQCAVGYVPFEIPAAPAPASVQYQALSPYRWTIRAAR